MRDKELTRVLDQVKLSREREDAILADLLGKEKEEARMQENKRRRIPAAALVVAVLAVVLAGTALAAEYFGKVKIELADNVIGSKDGYWAIGPGGAIPADSLSEEVLALCADMGPRDSASLPFDSWSKAEEYLGIELADNAVLDQFVKAYGIQYEKTTKTGRQVKRRTQCLLMIDAITQQHLPSRITLDASYERGNCTVIQLVQLATDAVEGDYKTGLGTAFDGEYSFQEYVTPNGLEVTIYSEVTQDRNTSRVGYMAYFVKNGAFFTVQLITDDNWRIDNSIKYYDPWDTLIEILDAYE